MLRKCLIALSLIFFIPAVLGDYHDAFSQNDCVFLYVYTSDCSYCKKFDPIYKKLSKKYGQNYKFLRINGMSDEGQSIMHLYGGNYVPFVMLLNNKSSKVTKVSPSCLLDYYCIETKSLNFFK